ncbi:MAG TPA: succinate dehydrogenase iron-sulfur subunit [Symbiobacteriaceae bacterium]|jgi:succinate dehydrogenase / fumarate reductase iron-sulfur subunit
MSEQKFIELRIKRQEGPGKPSYYEEFKLPYRANANVISCLMEIQRNPLTAEGKKTTPVVWDCNCLEEVCGACTMVVNGKVRQSCSTLIDNLTQPVTLEPMKSFPTVRDLAVDRSRMFEALKRVKAWVDIDGTHDLGPGPKQSPEMQEWMYHLSECMTCGCCVEACPNYNEKTTFVGPQAMSQVRLFNAHPSGAMHADDRLETLMGPGGASECGNAQNCVKACPKEIPLTTSIANINRALTGYAIKKVLDK